LESRLGATPALFANWRLEDLRVGHRSSIVIDCYWKIFWENFSECLHCPALHPELTKVVPVYAKGLMSELELPESERTAGGDGDAPQTPLAPGAVTWSLDGKSQLPELPGLGDREKREGQTYGQLEPSLFAVGHVDYARTARIYPRAPSKRKSRWSGFFPSL
jgi:Rieske 2Fe-2S family protein